MEVSDMAIRSRVTLIGWALAIAVPLGMLVFAWCYSTGALPIPTNVPSALAPESLAWELAGPVGLGAAILAQPRWHIVWRVVGVAIAEPLYVTAEFYALIALSGAMGEPF
jgi:hypothetical protein